MTCSNCGRYLASMSQSASRVGVSLRAAYLLANSASVMYLKYRVNFGRATYVIFAELRKNMAIKAVADPKPAQTELTGPFEMVAS